MGTVLLAVHFLPTLLSDQEDATPPASAPASTEIQQQAQPQRKLPAWFTLGGAAALFGIAALGYRDQKRYETMEEKERQKTPSNQPAPPS